MSLPRTERGLHSSHQKTVAYANAFWKGVILRNLYDGAWKPSIYEMDSNGQNVSEARHSHSNLYKIPYASLINRNNSYLS